MASKEEGVDSELMVVVGESKEMSTKELRRLANKAARAASEALERAARASLRHRMAKEAIERRAISAAVAKAKKAMADAMNAEARRLEEENKARSAALETEDVASSSLLESKSGGLEESKDDAMESKDDDVESKDDDLTENKTDNNMTESKDGDQLNNDGEGKYDNDLDESKDDNVEVTEAKTDNSTADDETQRIRVVPVPVPALTQSPGEKEKDEAKDDVCKPKKQEDSLSTDDDTSEKKEEDEEVIIVEAPVLPALNSEEMQARVVEAAKEEHTAIEYARKMVVVAERCAQRADEAEDRDARVLLQATSEFLATVLKSQQNTTTTAAATTIQSIKSSLSSIVNTTTLPADITSLNQPQDEEVEDGEETKEQQTHTLSKLVGATIGLLPGVSVSVATSESFVPKLVLTAFARQPFAPPQLPDREQLVFCSEHTTWEDLRLLILRWSTAENKNKNPQRIFIMANIHCLSYALQRKCSGKIEEILGEVRTSGQDIKDMAPLLLIAAENKVSHLLTHFGDRKVPIDTLSQKSIEIVAKNLSNEMSRGVRLYTSKHAGGGKSFQARQDARKSGLRVAHIPIYRSLTPSEFVTRIHESLIPIAISSLNNENVMTKYRKDVRKASEFIMSIVDGGIECSIFEAAVFWAERCTGEKYTIQEPSVALHFDLAPLRDLGSLDVLMFEMCWMGGIISSRTASQFVWNRNKTAIFIECQGKPLPSAALLETKMCVPSPDSFCATEIGLIQGRLRWIDDLKTLRLISGKSIVEVKEEEIKIPKFIQPMSEKQIKDMLKDFNSTVPAHIVNKIDLQRFLAKVMQGYTSSSGKPQDQKDSIRLLRRIPSYGSIIPDSKPKRFCQGSVELWDGLSSWARLQTVVHSVQFVEKHKFPTFFTPADACSSPLSAKECFTILVRCTRDRNRDISLHRVWSFIDCMYWQLRDLHHQESLIQKWCKWQKTWEMNKDFYNPFTRGTDGESVKAQVVHFSMKTAKEFAAKLFTEDGAIQSSSRARSSTESKTQNNNNNNTQNVVDQFRHLDEWGSSNHECLLFQISGDRRSGQSGGGLTFLSLKPQAMRSNLQQNQKQLFTELQTNQVVIGGNLDEIRGSFHEILGTVTGKFRTKAECESLLEGKFCVTGDAVLKMVAIFLRLKCGIPCVIMGDAGCGKTFLIKYLAAYLDIRRISLDIHGGTSRLDILGAVSEANAYARQGHEVLLFLDEVNTCNHMGLLNEIICSHSYYGTQIDSNVHIIGACNPYIIKPKSQDEDRAGLALQREQHNEMDNLVYKVQPVPATMLQYVFDFGALDLKTEQLYITSMVTNELIKSPNSNAKILEPAGWKPMVHLLTELLLEAQRYVRKVEDLRSATSLRDVRRCLLLIQWFATKPDPVYILSRLDSSVVQNDDDDDGDSTGGGIKGNLEDLSEKRLEAVILAVAHVYYYRLADLNIRSAFWNKVSRIFSRDPRWRNIFDAKGCEMLLFQEQTKYCSQMELEKGIALNDALRENLFVMMVSIFNRIPVFVVGKPGSSKSLAMQIISNNLRGASSPKRFWREFPAIHVVPYQCSPLSTSESIRYQWNKARSYQKKQKKVITVLLLDEVGLAELSPDMPLKVLHEVLTNNEVGIVGISNWVLDPAKMNRAILLRRPDPRNDDLESTAAAIVYGREASQQKDRPAWLKNVAEAYHYIYTEQRKKDVCGDKYNRDFVGMRDYYHMLKYLRRALAAGDKPVDSIIRTRQRGSTGSDEDWVKVG